MIQAKLLDARSRGPEKPLQGRIRRGHPSRLRRSRVSRWTASGNYRCYDWRASSGSVVANDPINGVDPTGLEIRVISDDAREKARVYAAIAITAETDPKVAERINTLERSDFVHRVQLGDIRNAGENVADYRPGGQVDMAGTGTGTVTTLQRGQFEKGGNQAISTIAHELAGHAYENDQGLLDRSRNPETGVRRSEESAVRIENVAREAIGLPVRETYLGRQVEDPRRELDD